MKKQVLFLKNKRLEYCLVKNRSAKRIKIRLSGGEIKVTLPYWTPYRIGEKFVASQKSWIEEKMSELEGTSGAHSRLTRDDYLNNKESARYFLAKKLEYFNRYYNFQYKKVYVKDQKSRWGSCSSNRNLNFSYKIIFLPEHLADYIVVHELCHLKELNHSPRFWELVERSIPDHRQRRKELRNMFF
ncbi:MAG: M48 family metallopeptidase [Patescibacteria group bacterium]